MTPLAWILLAFGIPLALFVAWCGVGLVVGAWQTRGWGRGPRHRPRLRVDPRDHLSVGQEVYVHQDGFVRPCPPPDPPPTITWDEHDADPMAAMERAKVAPVHVTDGDGTGMLLDCTPLDEREVDHG